MRRLMLINSGLNWILQKPDQYYKVSYPSAYYLHMEVRGEKKFINKLKKKILNWINE